MWKALKKKKKKDLGDLATHLVLLLTGCDFEALFTHRQSLNFFISKSWK